MWPVVPRDGSLGEDHHPETHLIPVILQTLLGQREKLVVFGTNYPTPDGTCIRDYIHVEDLCEAHIVAMNALEPGDARFYNLGIGRGYSVKEVIDSVERVTGKKCRWNTALGGPATLPPCMPTPRRSVTSWAGRHGIRRSTRSWPRPGTGSRTIRTGMRSDSHAHRFLLFPRIALLVSPRCSDPAGSSSCPLIPLVICRSKYFRTASGKNRVRWAMP